MNKISTKLAAWFLLAVLVLESFLMFYLYNNIIDSRVEEEFNSILSRGNSHRDVLEDSYTEGTLSHIALMESKTETEVVITDLDKQIIVSSRSVSKRMKEIMTRHSSDVSRNGTVIESNWREMRYLATVTRFSSSGQEGYVYMFKDTAPMRQLIEKLNHHFFLASVLSLLAIAFIYFILSKFLTRPLIKMKEATEQLSKGHFQVKLPPAGKDELGELSTSIQKLASDLKIIQKSRLDFLASISHELRTPLTYMQGYTAIALREGLPDSERREYLEIIQDESAKLGNLINNLFQLAKIDQTNFTIQKQEIDLCRILGELTAKVKPAFNGKNIELQTCCKEGLTLSADPLRFEQIIYNLLDNALKYSDEHTKTAVHAEQTAKGTVKILIEDQGKGIPQADLKYVFDRLYRVDKSRSRENGGSGLGLSIVKELVEAHGGTIHISSQETKGTIVEIEI
ncbi:MAG: sensor histidine kinase [Bacillota bacterium]